MTRSNFHTILLVLALSSTAWSANWPQWRGPHATGVSDETNLPTAWGETQNVTWRLELPAWSGSTPIVWGERVFLNVAEGEDLSLWCVDRNTGHPVWKRPLGSGNQKMRKQNMSSPSPVVDGKTVWTLTGTGVLAAFDWDGKALWKREIQKDYGPFGLNWGYASSALLHGETLYVPVLHGMRTDDPSYLLAIDKTTGETRWRVERPTDALMESPDAYTTPVVARPQGGDEIVVSGGDYVTGHDPETGRELWRSGGLNPNRQRNYRVVASPVAIGDLLLVPSRNKPLLALRAGGRGDVTDSHRLWSTDQGPDVPTPVSDGRSVFILGDKGILWKLDAKSGQVIWGPQRIRPGTYSASPVLADGKLYAVSEDGVTSVVVATGSEFEVLAENELNGYTLSSPAISNGQVFIRTDKYLYCIGKRH